MPLDDDAAASPVPPAPTRPKRQRAPKPRKARLIVPQQRAALLRLVRKGFGRDLACLVLRIPYRRFYATTDAIPDFKSAFWEAVRTARDPANLCREWRAAGGDATFAKRYSRRYDLGEQAAVSRAQRITELRSGFLFPRAVRRNFRATCRALLRQIAPERRVAAVEQIMANPLACQLGLVAADLHAELADPEQAIPTAETDLDPAHEATRDTEDYDFAPEESREVLPELVDEMERDRRRAARRVRRSQPQPIPSVLGPATRPVSIQAAYRAILQIIEQRAAEANLPIASTPVPVTESP